MAADSCNLTTSLFWNQFSKYCRLFGVCVWEQHAGMCMMILTFMKCVKCVCLLP